MNHHIMHQLMICLLAPIVLALASGCAMPQMQKQRSKPHAASYPKDNNSPAIKPGSIGGILFFICARLFAISPLSFTKSFVHLFA
jgi:hypothetical protein